jgi:heme oxygenase
MLASLISKLGDFKCLLVGKVEKDNLLDIVEDNLFFIYGKFRKRFYKLK